MRNHLIMTVTGSAVPDWGRSEVVFTARSPDRSHLLQSSLKVSGTVTLLVKALEYSFCDWSQLYTTVLLTFNDYSIFMIFVNHQSEARMLEKDEVVLKPYLLKKFRCTASASD